MQRQVKVDPAAAQRASSAGSSSGSAGHVQPVDHRVLVERQPPAPQYTQPRPPVPSTARSAPPGARPTPPMGRPVPSATTRGTHHPQSIIHEDVAWDESPVWEHSHGAPCGSSCGAGGCHPDLACNLWFNAEMLVWWRSGRSLPRLVTTGTGPTPAEATQTTLFGGQHYNSDASIGGRVELGYWLTPSRTTGIAMRYWQLGTEELNFAATSDQFRVLARPFLDVGTGPAFPNFQQISNSFGTPVTTGDVLVSSESNALGADVYLRRLMAHHCGTRIEYLLGYQLSRIDEDLVIRTNSLQTPFSVQDTFVTKNEFHGATLGLLTHSQVGCWNLDMMTKFGLGNMQQTVVIDGFDDVGTGPRPGRGLLARSTNMGTHRRDRFAVVPEFNFTAARQLSCNAELTLGYSALIYTGVVQPGDQIDPQLAADLALPPNVNRPAFQFNDRSYVIQGLNFGFRYRY